jgi:hypothetical protein
MPRMALPTGPRTVNARRYARTQLDSVIHQCFSDDSERRQRFLFLVACVRAHSGLLQPTDQGQSVLETLMRLVKHGAEFERCPSTWRPPSPSWHEQLVSIVQHVRCRYPVPEFLANSWWKADAPRHHLEWCVEHGRGLPFRRLSGLPFALTRRMERALMHTPRHLDVESALRRAVVLGLGGDRTLFSVLESAGLAQWSQEPDLMMALVDFFVRCSDDLSPGDFEPLVTYISWRRDQDPAFNLAGRTVRALRESIWGWWSQRPRPRHTWHRSRWSPMAWARVCDGSERRWELIELLSAHDLNVEGHEMSHCVRTYAYRCSARRSSIWSLRKVLAGGRHKSEVTVEVCQKSGKLKQVKSRCNKRPSIFARSLLAEWVEREGLKSGGHLALSE